MLASVATVDDGGCESINARNGIRAGTPTICDVAAAADGLFVRQSSSTNTATGRATAALVDDVIVLPTVFDCNPPFAFHVVAIPPFSLFIVIRDGKWVYDDDDAA
jgi:hypothetical protein